MKDGFLTQKEWTAKTLVKAADVRDMVLKILWEDEQGILESPGPAKKPSRLQITLKKVADMEKEVELQGNTLREARMEMIDQGFQAEVQALDGLWEKFLKSSNGLFKCIEDAPANLAKIEGHVDHEFSKPEIGVLGCKLVVVDNDIEDKTDLLGSLGQPMKEAVVAGLCAQLGLDADAMEIAEIGDGDEVWVGLTMEVEAVQKAAGLESSGKDPAAEESLEGHVDNIFSILAAREEQKQKIETKTKLAKRLQALRDGRAEILRRREVRVLNLFAHIKYRSLMGLLCLERSPS